MLGYFHRIITKLQVSGVVEVTSCADKLLAVDGSNEHVMP